jgi:hypothetical protein
MAREQSLTYRIQAKSDRLERDLALANKKLGRFKNQTRVNMDGIRNSFVGAFGGFIVLSAVQSAIKSLAGFELQMDKVAAISGATAKQMDELKASALELGRTTIFTAGEIGKMQEELARLGFEPDRILASSEAISKLALVTSSELGEAAKTMAGTLNGFNLEAKESGRVANVMAESFAKSALNMEKFTVGTANSSAIARVFGASVESNTARLGKLVDANIDASKAGTDLRKIYIELNANGLTYDEGMQKIASSTDKIKTATELFGLRAAGAAVILSGLQGEVKLLAGELLDSNKEIDHMAGVMAGNLSTDMKLFSSSIDGVIQRLHPLKDALSELFQGATAYVNFINNDQIPTWKRWVGSLTGGILPGIRDQYTETARLFTLEKERAKSLVTDVKQSEASATALRLYNNAVDKTRLGLDAMLLSEKIAFNPNIAKVRIELLGLIKKATEDYTASILKQTNAQITSAEAQELFTKKYEDFLKANKLALNSRRAEAALSVAGEQGSSPMVAMAAQMKIDLVAFKEVTGEYKKTYEKMTDDMIQFNDMLSEIVNNTLRNTFAGIGEAIGSGAGLKGALSNIAGVIGTGIGEIGKLMIAWGVAQIAFDTALKAIFGGGPAAGAAAIVAGTALVAAGAAVSRAQGALSDSIGGGGGSGGSTGPRGSFTGGATGQSIGVQGEFRIRGEDLVYVLDRQQRGRSRTG